MVICFLLMHTGRTSCEMPSVSSYFWCRIRVCKFMHGTLSTVLTVDFNGVRGRELFEIY